MIPSLATRGATATFSAVKIPPADVMEDLLVPAWLSHRRANKGHPSSLMAHPEVMQAIPVKPGKR